MTEISFYHLTRSSLEQALPSLLQKTLEHGWKAVVLAGSSERTEALAQFLWTYRTDSFLPHGSKKDGKASEQPIWLTETDERPNEADVLFLTDGAVSQQIAAYKRVCLLFDGTNEESLAAARALWKSWKADGHALTYWQQDASSSTSGAWKKHTLSQEGA